VASTTSGPAYTTAMDEAGGKRNVNWAAARGKWNVASRLKDNSQVSTLSAFYRMGKLYGFGFKNWADCQSDGGDDRRRRRRRDSVPASPAVLIPTG
jgi:uncharacterized protein (TIGR02217 family)